MSKYAKLAEDQNTYDNTYNYPYGSLIPVIRPRVLIPEYMKEPYRDKDGKMVRWAKVLVEEPPDKGTVVQENRWVES